MTVNTKMNCLFWIFTLFTVVYSNCPNGWLWNNSTCYLFSNDQQPMAAASYMCKTYDSHLVEIFSTNEDAYLKKVLTFYSHTYWIGLNSLQGVNHWMWLDSKKTLNETNYVNWLPGQPDNLSHDEFCVQIIGSTGEWRSVSCTRNSRYICEKPDPIV
ncbi:defense response to nematode [Mactra antiquata]